jgi:hypothetical protein
VGHPLQPEGGVCLEWDQLPHSCLSMQVSVCFVSPKSNTGFLLLKLYSPRLSTGPAAVSGSRTLSALRSAGGTPPVYWQAGGGDLHI